MASWFNPGDGVSGGRKATTQLQGSGGGGGGGFTSPIVIQGRPVSIPFEGLVGAGRPVASTSSNNNVNGFYVRQSDDDHQQTKNNNKWDYNNNNAASATTATTAITTGNYSKKQDRGQCRDVIWAILFYMHLIGIAVLTVVYTPLAMNNAVSNYASNSGQRLVRRWLQEDNNGNGGGGYDQQENSNGFDDINPGQIVLILFVAGTFGTILSSLTLGFMAKFAILLVKTALLFNVVFFGGLALLSIVTGSIFTAVMACLMCGLSVWYAYAVWDRIPFAASNLITSVTAVRSNIGLVMYAFLSVLYIFGWSLWWTIVTGSTLFVLSDCDSDGECQNEVSIGILFLFFLSFYWTVQVIVNVVHVTTAGTVGTWWFNPNEANGCCSEAVRNSYIRSLTSSFGSICLGSLIVALIQAVKEGVHTMRQQDDQLLMCIAECIIGCIESLVEYFNKWAFVYVGLYGFSFMEAGSNVMTLFRERGWTTIITDNMVDTVLFMVSVGVGAMTALFTAIVAAVSQAGNIIILTIIGFIVGYSLCATLLSVVSSAVNTVIVCYAEAPNEFQTNHPHLATNMKEAWSQAYPEEFRY